MAVKEPSGGLLARLVGDRSELPRRLKSAFAVALSLTILVGAGAFVLVKANETYYEIRTVDDYIGDGTEDVEVTIPKGASVGSIGGLLVSAKVIKTSRAFSSAVNDQPNTVTINAGKYKLKKQLPAAKALAMLLDRANLIRIKMTIQEGLTLKQTSAIMAQKTGLTDAAMAAALKDTTKLGLPAWANKQPEGFLFPDTYELEENSTARQVILLTTTQFTKVTNSINFASRAKANGMSAYQALTIASIIESEVHNSEYQAKVSRVIYNRLAAGQLLQMDSTVHYAVGKSGSVTTSDQDRKNPSKYNTYIHKGLPPTPIASPGKSAMDAAVSPEAGAWMYFVTVDLDTGETLFATTAAEHQQNVAKFQKWCNDHSGRC